MFRAALACCTALALTAGTAAAQTMSCGIGIGKPCPSSQGDLLEWLARAHPMPKPVVRKTVLQAEYGGRIDQHWQRFQQLAMDGDEVEIRGPCESACTLVLAPIPKQRLCFGKDARLAFHQARQVTGDAPAPEDTRWMIDKYPADIRTWIETRGGAKKMPLVGYWVLYASDLWEMGYRKCD